MLVDVKVSENFRLREFACGGVEHGCPCHGAVLLDRRLVEVLQEFRAQIGGPLAVTSAFRCDWWNAHERVGGHAKSFHRVGFAADVTCAEIAADMTKWTGAVAAILDERHPGSCNVIAYRNRNFLHVDVGHRVDVELVRVNLSAPKARGW